MERYTVSIRFPETGKNLLLLIPFSSTSSVSAFAEEVRRRAAKHDHALAERIFSLHLGQEDGPILDFDDMLSETIVDSRRERIFLIFQGTVPETGIVRSRIVSVVVQSPKLSSAVYYLHNLDHPRHLVSTCRILEGLKFVSLLLP